MKIVHSERERFLHGNFGNGGANLFVDAGGVMRRIMDNDLNGDGIFDIAFPNSHGYIERGPTTIYTQSDGAWEQTDLPHDSCWLAKAVDVDGDGYLDLVIANGENGVTSELQSYIYWGGPAGLTGDRTVFDTIGAYDVAVCDIDGNGLKDVIFSTAWYDHHNAGASLLQKVFVQTAPREFHDATDEFRIPGMASLSLVCEDLNGDGYPDLVLANYREGFDNDTDSFVYWGTPDGFDTAHPVRLPTHYALQVIAADLNGDGFKELVFTGGNQVAIYWNDAGAFSADRRLILDVAGMNSQFSQGVVTTDIADIDADGIPELVIGTVEGVEIRKATDLRKVWQMLPCYSCTCVKAADIRNSGRMDIITSHYCSEKSYDAESLVFWNDGNGYSIENVTAFETHGPMGCMAADLDNDGVNEIIYCNTMSGPSQYDTEFPVFVYHGTPDHRYPPANRRDYPVRYGSTSYVVADVDNDGFVELIATTSNGLRVFQGTPDGPDPSDYYDLVHTAAMVVGVGGVLVGDFNRDGWLDLIMAPWMYGNSPEQLENSVFVYFGGPDGFRNDRRIVLPAYNACANAVQLGDVNNDGYLDFLYGDAEGFVGVYYGGPDGFDRSRFGKIPLRDWNGALIMGITVADIDGDGWLELLVTTAGHYTRRSSHLYIMRDGEHGFPPDKMTVFETGGTTGFPDLADLTRSGRLDLLLPFYSTTETRELPARIFRSDGQGDFDWENPVAIDCLASIAFCPVDLSGNGYPDLFICCHRNDLGHMVDSKLILNGPDGLAMDDAQDLLGYGPHCFTNQNQANLSDRSDAERYTSPIFECRRPRRIAWEGETPHKTSLAFRVRFGRSVEETGGAAWSEPLTHSGSDIHPPAGATHMQYEVTFRSPGLVNSARLSSVTIECE